jgi:hypothetical protein
MSRLPKFTTAGAPLAPLLLPFLAVAVLGCVAVTGRTSGTQMRDGDTEARAASLYAPQAFTPRFAPLWTMLLRTQYGTVCRCADEFRAAGRPDERARAQAEYLVCLREYDRLAVLVPAEAFAGQRLPHYLPESAFPAPDRVGLG